MGWSREAKGRLGLLATLYFSQGLPYGFFVEALPVLLRQRGVSLEGIGLASLLYWPWALKFLWAPVVDHRYSERVGRRRSWLIPLQCLNACLLLLMAAWDPGRGLVWLLAVVMAINVVSATHDIAADGLAVELLGPSERGPGNSVQVGAYRVGMILGGGVMLMAQAALGWGLTFMSMSGLLLLALVPLLRHREGPPRVATEAMTEATTARVKPMEAFKGFVGSGVGRQALLVIVAYRLGDGLTTGMLKPFMVDGGLGLADIGLIVGVIGSAAGLLGAALGGLLIRPLGRRRALWLFLLAQASGFAAYGVVAWAGWRAPWVFMTLSGLEHVASGMATVGLFTCMMDWCREEHAATDYTLQASAVVLTTGVGAILGGLMAGRLRAWLPGDMGYATHFLLGAALCVAAWPWMARQEAALGVVSET